MGGGPTSKLTRYVRNSVLSKSKSKLYTVCCSILHLLTFIHFNFSGLNETAKINLLRILFKTVELTRLQVGDGPRPSNVIVSTIKEAENVTPLLLEMKKANRAVNVSPLVPTKWGEASSRLKK